MLHLPALPLAGILGLGLPEIIVILVLMMGPVMVVAIVGFALYFKHKQRQAWHELARIALEKGQPIPPYPGRCAEEAMASAMETGGYRRLHHGSRRRDLTGWLVMLAIGAAIYLGMPPGNRGSLMFAYVPAFIGLALLLSTLIDAIFSRTKDDPGTQPPKA